MDSKEFEERVVSLLRNKYPNLNVCAMTSACLNGGMEVIVAVVTRHMRMSERVAKDMAAEIVLDGDGVFIVGVDSGIRNTCVVVTKYI